MEAYRTTNFALALCDYDCTKAVFENKVLIKDVDLKERTI
jgi:hypothetical protein